MCSLSEIPFGEDSGRIETSQTDVQFGSIDCFLYDRIFAGKVSEQTLIWYVLNVVNNCKNLFISSCILMLRFFFTIYYMCQ